MAPRDTSHITTPARSTKPSVTVSAQMMPASPNQRLPRRTTGMKSTPCVIDITVAGTARPVAWNSDVSRPANPFATMATS